MSRLLDSAPWPFFAADLTFFLYEKSYELIVLQANDLRSMNLRDCAVNVGFLMDLKCSIFWEVRSQDHSIWFLLAESGRIMVFLAVASWIYKIFGVCVCVCMCFLIGFGREWIWWALEFGLAWWLGLEYVGWYDLCECCLFRFLSWCFWMLSILSRKL